MAPLVSGVIELLLESKPTLGWRDVQEILIRSARKVDDQSSGWPTNGAGYHFHHGYGAGMIDAAAAVTLAPSWVFTRRPYRFYSGVYSRRCCNWQRWV